MGVKGLWSIVSPVGIRVNPEIFSGKRIAIDVSIWLYELTYANNLKVLKNNSFDNFSIFNDLYLDFSQNVSNEIKTDSLKKVHLYFFFLRICKLLYYNIKPIFIFDGNPPELKKKTIFQRNLKKINYEEKFKKTAEKLVYNYYKRTLFKSLKNKKNALKKKKDSEKCLLHKVPNIIRNNSLDTLEITENEATLDSIVEKVGNVSVSVKDVLNFCNDDLCNIENQTLMIADSNHFVQGKSQNREWNGEKSEEKTKKKEKYIGITNNCDNISKEYVLYDEDCNNQKEVIMESKEKSTINIHSINNIDNEINEEIVRKKKRCKKKIL